MVQVAHDMHTYHREHFEAVLFFTIKHVHLNTVYIYMYNILCTYHSLYAFRKSV